MTLKPLLYIGGAIFSALLVIWLTADDVRVDRTSRPFIGATPEVTASAPVYEKHDPRFGLWRSGDYVLQIDADSVHQGYTGDEHRACFQAQFDGSTGVDELVVILGDGRVAYWKVYWFSVKPNEMELSGHTWRRR